MEPYITQYSPNKPNCIPLSARWVDRDFEQAVASRAYLAIRGCCVILIILGLNWDYGKENGNYCNGSYRDYIGVILG